MSEPCVKKYHLVVLVHGLWGHGAHLEYISKALQEHYVSKFGLRKEGEFTDEEIVIYTTHLNEGYKTYDGIDVCGVRVAREIEDRIEQLGAVTKFSLCGYSLGGLISRYAAGLLHRRQFFKKKDIELINFTTFCTPHVGVLAPGKNVAVNLFNAIVPTVLGNSGKQMFLKDKVKRANGLPLVYLMGMEGSVFYRALQEFRYISLYANVINDKRTAWWTSGISRNDPFFDVTEQNGIHRFSYIKGYEPIVLDHMKPIKIFRIEDVEIADKSICEKLKGEHEKTHVVRENGSKVDRREYFFFKYWIAKIGRWILVFLNLVLIAPLWVVWFLISGFMETVKSTVRVTTFLRKYSHQLIQDFYDIPLEPLSEASSDLSATLTNEYEQHIQESLNDQTDTFIESLYDAIERKNTLAAAVRESSPDLDLVPNSTSDASDSITTTIRELETTSVDHIISRAKGANLKKLPPLQNLRLAISPRQLDIIDSLNKLAWQKFPIYIRNTSSSHACAIVRHEDPNFEEGKVVVKHWVEEVFKFE
ncbi:LAMI_0D08570g1_1 [Lachancea mirantina]|uniref:LAMI_0D08570g1_1 n=1 Tax=Lachancea mirantina TaxID=1230905 RepID=A0A1G4JDC9_9SACH|nr:LAMI_0D08570g1_1 [Lachancea mirantina]